MDNRLKIAVLNVATGKYINFIDPLYECISKYFFVDHDVDCFLFTDSDREFNGAKKYKIDRKGFPGDTLYRYHYFLLAEDKLKNYDFLFYLDVDMDIVDFIDEKIVHDMLAVYHPGFYKKHNGTFERRSNCQAFLPSNVTGPYFCGGVQGGKPEHYLKACHAIKKAIDLDNKNNITAVWHDESHWNAYLHKNKPNLKVLSPRYCYYPFKWLLDMEKQAKIVALDKDHEEIRA
tara:strand:+ start:68 stop:763 length:696 start_codon:yes stop_codon:yes gene_type:complete